MSTPKRKCLFEKLFERYWNVAQDRIEVQIEIAIFHSENWSNIRQKSWKWGGFENWREKIVNGLEFSEDSYHIVGCRTLWNSVRMIQNGCLNDSVISFFNWRTLAILKTYLKHRCIWMTLTTFISIHTYCHWYLPESVIFL